MNRGQHNRGFKSHTYDILSAELDLDALVIHVHHAAAVRPWPFRPVDPDLAAHPVTVQLLEQCHRSIAVSKGAGDWYSRVTLQFLVSYVRRLQVSLIRNGVSDLASPDVTVNQLSKSYGIFEGTVAATMVKLLAAAWRSAGAAPRDVAPLDDIRHGQGPAGDPGSRTAPYEDAEVQALESAAQSVLLAAHSDFLQLLTVLGIDGRGRKWLGVDGDRILADARARDAARTTSLVGHVPLNRAPDIDQVDWLLLNPDELRPGRKSPSLTIDRWRDLVYPPLDLFTCCAILMCLTENSGLNFSTILGIVDDQARHVAPDVLQVHLAKARSNQAGYRPVKTDGWLTWGGVQQALLAFTAVARAVRREQMRTAGTYAANQALAHRLYVRQQADPDKYKLLSYTDMRNALSDSQRFRSALGLATRGKSDISIRWRSLRHAALARAIHDASEDDVHGHTRETRVGYLENCLTDDRFAQLLNASYEQMESGALAKFVEGSKVASKIARAKNTEAWKRISASDCANGGRDPDDDAKPCSLGLAACFVCPHGYRTTDNLPGLIALREYTKAIRDNKPQEWHSGEARKLHGYAVGTLDRLPKRLVAQAERTIDLDTEVLVIHFLYTEARIDPESATT